MPSAAPSSHLKYIFKHVARAFGLPIFQVEEQMARSPNVQELDAFMEEDGPSQLLVSRHPDTIPALPKREWDGEGLVVTEGDTCRLEGKGVVLMKVNEGTKIDTAHTEREVVVSVIVGSPMKSLLATIDHLFLPLLSQSSPAWKAKLPDEAGNELFTAMQKFVQMLSDSANGMDRIVELAKPSMKLAEIELKNTALTRAALNPELVRSFESAVTTWSETVEILLDDLPPEPAAIAQSSAGPSTELEYWKARMGRLNSVAEQLRSRECKVVLGVLKAARSRTLRHWKGLENSVNDSVNEAKDTVKYLVTLEKFIEPLYSAPPRSIVDHLPGLMSNIRMMVTIARFYNTPERIETLLCKIANQIINRCSSHVEAYGRLWAQPIDELLVRLRDCLALDAAYREEYRKCSDSLQSQLKGKQLELDEELLFTKLDAFAARLEKLVSFFTTIDQFKALSQHTIEGMSALFADFHLTLDRFQSKSYDLLDYRKSYFDRDLLEFNTTISELEQALQAFINQSFESINSTSHALGLLQRFQAILQRDSLKEDLESKLTVIFHNYGLDLETVQQLYEKQKSGPLIVRNAPPVAGNVLWARQLMRRIELPMQKFQQHTSLMSTKESKKIVKTYNRIARTIIEFETLWQLAWVKSIDASKAGLQATLLIRHPKNNRLYVNFDREVLLLIRETKSLMRMGVAVPESARLVVLQENKFKSFYNQLSYAIVEYEKVLSRVPPIIGVLLKPHLDDMQRKLHPGMVTLTWTSMNIDAFMHTTNAGVAALDDLVTKIRDLIENRIERNLKAVSKMGLVELPKDESFSLEKFVIVQEKLTKARLQTLSSKNLEIEEAVSDLFVLITEFPLERPASNTLHEAEAAKLRLHYSRLFYRAVSHSTKMALRQIKKRIGSKASGGFLFLERPFFDVNVELTIPSVIMSPSLDDIQAAINRSCRAIIGLSRHLPMWGSHEDKASGRSIHDVLAKDKEIVRTVLLLTGSMEGAKRQVYTYLSSFSKYDWLWQGNMQAEYTQFMSRRPNLDEFETELKKYGELEREISHIAPVHNIGALSLETAPLKYSLRSECLAWKALYGNNLHEQAKTKLETISKWMNDMGRNLKREVKDLEDVRTAMNYLKELRERESGVDAFLSPVEEMYRLLNTYEVSVSKEESDQVADLRYSWRKLLNLSNEVNNNLADLQVGFKRDLVRNVKVFLQDVEKFRLDFQTNGPMVKGITANEATARLKRFQMLYEQRERKFKNYRSGEELFGLTPTQYPELERTKKELDLLERLYALYTAVNNFVVETHDMPWSEVTAALPSMIARVSDFQASCAKMPRELRQWEAYTELKAKIDEFFLSMPLVQLLSHPSMRMRHWTQLVNITGQQLAVGSDRFKLNDVLQAGLLEYREDVEEITASALKELQIDEKLTSISDDWSDEQLTFTQFKHRGYICLKGAETVAVIEKCEETLMALGSMMASRYIAPFRDQVQSWVNKLSTVTDVLEQWIQVQAMWLYLEAVFTSGDIAKQLPHESKRFQAIDKNWEKIMSKALETRNVVAYCHGNDVLIEMLPHMLEQLEVCQKALSGYLDQKRATFPRFYFVSDANLLEVLSQSSNPSAIQPHLQSVFAAIMRLGFDEKHKSRIVELFDSYGEVIKLERPVEMQGNIEEWLSKLLLSMQHSVNSIVRDAAADCEAMPLEQFTLKYPSQVALLGIQFKWTLDCEDALYRARKEKHILNQVVKKNQQRLTELVRLNLKSDQELSVHGPWTRTKIETMILVDVHQRDCFEEMSKLKIREPDHFEWQKQARFYFLHEQDVAQIVIADVEFSYCNEYLGVKERLVITPLTDRCYITLSQALGMCLGGAPAGPAGTGKTETVKDMGCTLGKYVVVFNCSDQMDYRVMGGIIKGLAKSGCWGCFDEFNRIDLEVLSVVAQQVMSVLDAMKHMRSSFQFTDGASVDLNRECGFFITMNPGYAGRQELPENLKSLFRGVTMMVPDRQIIMKVKLAACGYTSNSLLAKKFDVLYRLCEQQLSNQPHCAQHDFGLRNILAVLRTAGKSKRLDLQAQEMPLLMRTLRDMNLSKFVSEDVPLFLSLIGDLFPGVNADKMAHDTMDAQLKFSISKLQLQHFETWQLKIVQVYEMALVRHSLMLVGPSGVGKSKIVEVLHDAVSSAPAGENDPPLMSQPHRETRMFPKAITAPQMFGSLDVIANEWTEGIFAQLWRKANKDKKNFTWLVLDGPVDAIWIENLNTVMDDNKILTLANNDRIPMLRPNVTLHFEVEDLRNASPATVSRAGIIYVSTMDLGWEPFVKSYLASRTSEERNTLFPLFSKYVECVLSFVTRECTPCMVCADMGLITSLTTLLTALLSVHNTGKVEGAEAHSAALIERIFIFALVWTVGGILDQSDRSKVDKFLRNMSTALPASREQDTVYEFRVSEGSGEWEHWSTRVPEWQPVSNLGDTFASILVPTIDSARLEHAIDLALSQHRPVLLIGGSGTAKTSAVLQVLGQQDPTRTLTKSISFSSATTPLIFQSTAEGFVEKRQGRTFGPPGNKRMIVFIDDISMPAINPWGDQVTLEVVRQLVECSGVYNLQKPGEWKSIVDLDFIGCMLTPGGGNNDIPNRAKRHFHVMNVSLPSNASIHQIFGSMIAVAFSEEIVPKKVAEIAQRKLVPMTVDIWQRTKSKMLPTPSKFHYIFNLRDLSRVFQGIFMCHLEEVIVTEEDLFALWRHECLRVFSDRLVNHEDKTWFHDTIQQTILASFGSLAANIAHAERLCKELADTPRVFVDFMREPDEDADTGEELPPPRIYEPVTDMRALHAKVTDFMDRYSEHDRARIKLVLFEDAILHFTRIARILRTPRSSALLVGVGGSGRQSLTRLAAFVGGCSTSQITITKAYSATDLMQDFKPLYLTAGVKGQGVAFMFTDKELADDSLLEYLNIFLNTGEVPNLFARDEMDAIIGEVAETYESSMPRGAEVTSTKLWSYFIDRVRANLHIVLCMSPVGDKFRRRAQMFPGIINCCTIDWFLPWPSAALVDVAMFHLASFEPEGGEVIKRSLVEHVAYVHASVSAGTTEYFERYRRAVYVTPKTYLAFLDAYISTFEKKKSRVAFLANSINVGLEKLEQATKDVDLMKVELKEKEKGLRTAQQKSALLLQSITASTQRAEKKKSEVQAVKDKALDESRLIEEQKALIDEQLLAAKPALDEAENALKAITAKDIGVLKQLKQPPNLIQRLFDCVLLLLRVPMQPSSAVEVKGGLQLKDSWKEALSVMAQSTFLDSILKFDRDKVNDEDIELVYPYMQAEDFNYDAARKASGAVAGLCTWVKAMVTYHHIAKVVKPKMAEQKVAEGYLRIAMNKLKNAQAEVDQCQAELDDMQQEFDEAMASKQRIQADADSTQNRMNAANRLINGLAGEKSRWTSQSEAFNDEIRRLTGDVAIACAFMSYAGPFNAEFRNVLLNERFISDATKRKIPMTSNLAVTTFMVEPGTVGDWVIQGLPSDELSVQNGIMVTQSLRWPLMIDPQGQGLSWIKTREEVNQLRISTLTDKRFRSHLEDSMAFGQPLLLENVGEEIDPILDPVLDKAVQKAGRGLKIVLADKECEYSDSFSLFLCSNMANPHFSPELCAQVTMIDFTVTMAGLEQQLLGRVVLKERAELEEQRQKLVEEVNSNQKTLKALEDDLLYRLATSTGNLLDDTSLIEVLQHTKETSAEVQEKLETAELADQRISSACEEYRPVATRGSLLYFLVVDMASISPMYQVSLQQFLKLFDSAIEKSPSAPLASKRVVNIMEYATFHTTCYMQRGFFERHKHIWLLMLTMKIEVVAGKLSQAAVQALLTGGGALDIKSEKPKPAEWVPDSVWLNIVTLSRALPETFSDLAENFSRSLTEWKQWYDLDAPEQQRPPQTVTTAFDLLLVVRSVRDDRTILCAQDYIASTIGQKFIDSRPLDLREVEEEANCRSPIVAILSQGSDPTGPILELARKLKKLIRSISLGQGQEPAARKLISTGVTQGSWVMLQNCHLGLKFMLELEQTILKLEEIHPAFQLWITSEAHPKFPIGLLQMSIKITNEAPAGVRAGLKNSYAWVSQDMLDAQSQPQWKSMLYALCFMHTIVQERRKFGPLGFNIPYEFNHSDLSASVQYLQNHLSMSESKKRPMDWDAINYMICDVQYGGRITDDWDRRLFATYGQMWLSPVIFEVSFRFHEGYKIPVGMEVSDYRKAIEKLSLVDAPALFGLHSNADLAFRTRQTKLVLSTILDVQPKAGGVGDNETREEAVLRQLKALKGRLPNDFKKEDVADGIKKLGGSKPLNICLQQEVDRIQMVLSGVRNSLNNLALAIAGTIVMSPDLINTLDALYSARVPEAWLKASQLDAPSLGVWFTNILMRAEQLISWLSAGRPHCFWLTGFFNPQGFLTANRQEVCRKHAKDGWALDDVVNSTEVLKLEREEVKRHPDEGVHLHGLFLEGCRWDKMAQKLTDSEPKVLFAPMPVVLVSGQLANEATKAGQLFSAPCYKNPKRTDLNYIFALDLRTEDPPSKWTLRGCCVLASKDV